MITGGTGGIGTAVAEALAKKGHHLILIGQNKEKGAMAVEKIRERTGNSQVKFLSENLALIKNAVALASTSQHEARHVDAIVFASGILNSTYKETREGIEETFAMQYLNRAAMSLKFVQPFLNSKNGGQLIWIGAPLLPFATIDINNLQLKKGYSLFKAMSQIQLCAHLFVQEFAKQYGKKIKINIVSPGLVKTDLLHHIHGLPRLLGEIFLPLIANSPALAAQNIEALIDDPTLSTVSGHFFPKPGKAYKHHAIAQKKETATLLWEETQKILDSITKKGDTLS